MCFLVSRLYPHPMCLQVKSAFRVRSKQPDPHAVPKEGADTTKDTADPAPKGKGRGRGRKAKAQAAKPDKAAANVGEGEKPGDGVDEVPQSPTKTTTQAAEHNKRKSEVSVQTPTKPSPNKQPSKKRAPKPKPTGDDADKQVKDLWAVQDWKCLIYQQDICGLCNLTFFAGAAPSRSWSANS